MKYKIIIPKEEPKTNLERLPFPELVKEFAEYYKKVRLIEEPKQDNNFYEKLKQYFEETPNDEVMAAWERSKQFDNVGPTVDDFLNNTNKQRENLQSLESELDEVLSKETEESLTTWLDEKRSKQETLEEASWKYNPVRKLDNEFIRAAFIAGANYQAARMYSEDEVINLLYDFYNHTLKLQSLKLSSSLNIKDWFNKLKKK